MNCRKCNQELAEDSVFCKHCGTKVEEVLTTPPKPRNKKLYIMGGVGVLVILIAVYFIFWYKNPIGDFKSAIREDDSAQSNQIYTSDIQGDEDLEKKAKAFLIKEIQEVKEGYVAQKIDFDTAKSRIETIEKTDLANTEAEDALSEVDELQDSRTAFQKGKEFLDQKNYKEALGQLDQVIQTDENYNKAQELREQSSGEYKKAVLAEAEGFAKSKKYGDAVKLMDTAQSILPEEKEFAAKRESYYKNEQELLAAERKEKMQAAAKSQEVVVQRAKLLIQSDEYKALYPDMLQAIIYNKSSKTVKNMKVGFIAFDGNGYPVQIESQYGLENSFEYVGSAMNVNIVPNSSYGEGKGWEIEENKSIHTVRACVKEVEYYDESKWDNPYYDYWLEEYKEKPLH